MKKAFTLIELLVVIAIIAILAGVVLSAVTSAKDKGAVAAATKSIEQIKVTAELLSETGTNRYPADLCNQADIKKFLIDAADSLGYRTGFDAAGDIKTYDLSAAGTIADNGQVACSLRDDKKAYMITADIDLDVTTKKIYCIDSKNGVKLYETGTIPAAISSYICN